MRRTALCWRAADVAPRWDEWVPESRLLKLNEENQARQKQLMDAQLAKDRAERDALHAKEREARLGAGTAAAAGGAGSSRRESAAPRGQKRARESAAAVGDPVRRHRCPSSLT